VLAAQANQIQQLEAQISELMAAVTARPGPGGPTAKLSVPEKYEGGREGLKTFLTNMDLYCRFNAASFATEQDKILAAGMHMKGKAAAWLQPLTEDYLQNVDSISECKVDTKRVFKDWQSFKNAITLMFGEVDEEQQAERAISMIKQKGSANRYTTEFKQLQSKIDWDDAPLKTAYYNGLKENIKDEIAHNDRPDTLKDMIELAVRIDNRLYERALEKKSHHRPIIANTGRGRRVHTVRRDRDGDVIMDVDKVQEYKKGPRKDARKPYKTQRDGISEKERQKRFDDKACLKCGQQGHFRRDCPRNQDKVNAIKIAMVHGWATMETPEWDKETRNETLQVPAPGLPGFQKPDSDISDYELDEPEEIPDLIVSGRLANGNCWLCGIDTHLGAQCPKQEKRNLQVTGPRGWEITGQAIQEQGPPDARARFAEEEDSHLEGSWHQCARDDCEPHSDRRQEVRWQPGDDSHIFLPGSECMVSGCHIHDFEKWQENHETIGWMRCYEDSCGKHWPMKHLTGQYPLGPGAWYTEGCANDACNEQHPSHSHAKRPWRACKKENCLLHIARREKSAMHEEHHEHGYLMAYECMDPTCRRHGYKGQKGAKNPNHTAERIANAKMGWRVIYSNWEDQTMRKNKPKGQEWAPESEPSPEPKSDDEWSDAAKYISDEDMDQRDELEKECRELTNEAVRRAALEDGVKQLLKDWTRPTELSKN
jgi:hypothetical protein